MSRTKHECYIYACDVCGLDFENGDGVTLHFETNSGDGPSNWDDWHDWGEYGWHDGCEPNCSNCGHPFTAHDYGDNECGDCQNEECDAFDWKGNYPLCTPSKRRIG